MKAYSQFIKGLWEEVPVFRVVLGLCPALAVSTSLENALGMGIAATFVLVCSNCVVSLLRKIIPSKVRIPCYIVIAATFVTIVDLVMNAFAHSLHQSLGIFIPLIVVNCIILGRAEAFAGKNNLILSLADGLGMGLGFTMALCVVAVCREILGSGSITLWGDLKWTFHGYTPILIMILAPGGFVALGCILGLMNRINSYLAQRKGHHYTPPIDFDCRHCVICKWGE